MYSSFLSLSGVRVLSRYLRHAGLTPKLKSLYTLCLFLFLGTIPKMVNGAVIAVPADQPSIAAAIGVALSGDTIMVSAGEYTGTGQLHITTDLTIIGSGKDVTILKPGYNTGSSGDSRGWFLVDDAIEFNLFDLTLDGSGQLIWQAIRHKGPGNIDNVHFTEIKYNESGPSYAGTAIAAFGTGDVNISNSMFTEIGRVGVLYFGPGITSSTYHGNTYMGKGVGDWLDYALDISAGAYVNVDSNSISGNRGVASSDGSASAGILVSTFFGAGTEAHITRNMLTDNTIGVAVGYDGSDASTAVIQNNNIAGNEYGVVSTASVVDAQINWWGDASGPSGQGPGTGDTVSTNVLFCPWLDMPINGQPRSLEPLEVICPFDREIECTESLDPSNTGMATSPSPLVISFDYMDSVAIGPGAPILYYLYRTWEATNACNDTDTCLQTITITDEDGPNFVDCPADIQVILDDLGDCDTTVYWQPPSAVDACDVQGFTGYFTPSHFDQVYSGPGNGDNGLLNEALAPTSVIMTGTSNGTAGMNTNFDICLDMPVDGSISFDWSAVNIDIVGSLTDDEAGYVVDGVETLLATDPGCCQAGSTTISLMAGSTFCFRVKSDNQGGMTYFSVSNFNFNNTTVTQISGPTPDSAPGAGDGTPLTPGFHEVIYMAEDGLGNSTLCVFTVNVAATDNILCKKINVSLDQNCGVKVIPEMVIAGDYACTDGFVVNVLDHNVSIGDSIGFEYLGETLTYEVLDPSSGNSCWGEILVEDKFIPQILCMDDTMNCVQFMNTIIDPTVIEHCQTYEIIKVDEIITNMACDSQYLMYVTRKFIAKDASGNISDTCAQSVWIERFPLGQVTLAGQDTTIYCGSGFTRDANGNIDPAFVTVPMLDTIPLYPMTDFFCNLTVNYSDVSLGRSGCVEKILRTWKITEWWCRQDDNVLRQQLITIVDTTGPQVILPVDTIYGKAGRRSCDALVDLPAAAVSDACNTIERVDMNYPGGFSGHQNGGVIRLPIGYNTVEYRVYDSCYNMGTATLVVHVTDEVAPVAICEQNTVVSLDNDGLVRVMADAFDDGSFDECEIDSFSVRRMIDPCGTGTDQWGPFVEFCCEDLGNDVMVVFSVIDKSGNAGTCMVNVQVQDKLPPVIVSLPDITVSCTFDWDSAHLDVFGTYVFADSLRDSIIIDADSVAFSGDPLDGVVRDNCPPVMDETADMSNIDNCGLGYIVRSFTFTDGQGNVNVDTQRIYFINPAPFDSTQIIWPAHIDTADVCGIDNFRPELLPDTFAFPRFINENECSLVGYDYKDDVIDASQGNEACFKIIRTWTVIDWCQKEGGVHKKWSYDQVIEVANTIAPTIELNVFNDESCCPNLHLFGSLEMETITKVTTINDSKYLIGSTNVGGQVYPFFVRTDLDGDIVWQISLNEPATLADFCQTSANSFLIVGRIIGAGGDSDNESLLIEVDVNGNLLQSQRYDNFGREGFSQILVHENPVDPNAPYYILGFENTDGFYQTKRDQLQLYNLDLTGQIINSVEFTYSVDDQWLRNPIALSNGNIVSCGDQDVHPNPQFNHNGTLVEYDGGSMEIGNLKTATIDCRFIDMSITSTGLLLSSGWFGTPSSHQGGIFLFDDEYNTLSSVQFNTNDIEAVQHIELIDDQSFVALGQSPSGEPIIIYGTIDVNAINILGFKKFNNLGSSYGAGSINYNGSSIDFGIEIVGHSFGFGSQDILFGQLDINLNENCLVDANFTYTEVMFNMVNQPARTVNFTLPTSGALSPSISNLESVPSCEPFDKNTDTLLYCYYNNDCLPDSINLKASGDDDCTAEEDLFWRAKIDLFNDGDFDQVKNSNDFTDLYPMGVHKVKFLVEDLCGNLDSCEYLFELRNCKAPTAYCKNGVVAELTPIDTSGDGMPDIEEAEVWASDFDENSGHSCGHPVVLSFSADINDTLRVYNCDSLSPPTRNVTIWVTDLVTGEVSKCVTFVTVQDNNNVSICPSMSGGNVTGQLITQNDQMIMDVEVSLLNSNLNSVMTNQQGSYAFMHMPGGGIYDVLPEKDGDDLNGVSTADLVAIQRHLLGKKPLSSPYDLIAADVNNSESVSAGDISELRKMILGLYSDFPSNSSWRFVDAGFQFNHPTDPWKDNWPEYYHIEPLTGDMAIDFVGVKIGDVTGDVQTNVVGGNDTRSVYSLTLKDRKVSKGEMVEIPFTLKDLESVEGLQFTLEWNTDYLAFVDIKTNGGLEVSDANFGQHMLDKGVLTACWHSTSTWYLPGNDQKKLFTVGFIAERDGQLSNLIQSSGLITNNLIFKKGEERPLAFVIDFDESDAEYFTLYQNTPNPWQDVTNISFHLPAADDVQLSIYDDNGRLLKSYQDYFEKGFNSISVNKEDLGASGMLIYRLETREHVAMKKMVLIR